MTDAARILNAIEQGDARATKELRRLATQKMSRESPSVSGWPARSFG